MSTRVAVYGGRGGLGSVIVDYFKSKNFWALSIDVLRNETADANIVVNKDASWTEQEGFILKSIGETLNGERLDAILCVAGGWAGGSANSENMIKNSEILWKQNVWTSTISARIAALYLKNGGLLQFTGAASVLKDTSAMLGYGMAKAAVHQLTRSLAAKKSGMPDKSTVVALLPTMLDTAQNRKWMPKANTDSWTSLNYIAELLHEWTLDLPSRPPNGSLVEIITQNGQNELKIH
ncbi:dihydropteridine reductase-PC [Loa loa]|uniref:Dihydropteridine reductase n=1 Tax=Loa loa TaxID=7209 RepID=A0A1I7VRQ6_LOALO|nr:dihydropteridine reductase-PC [Loa loa]EFO25938.1 dihydropteridine reductase-PC [Loa loa]